MIQRTIQRSVTEYLDGNGDDYDAPAVARIKRTTAVDLTTKIYIGAGVYHRFQRGGVSGCPNWGDEQEPATIADAIEQGIDPCENCNPPDYRATDETDITLPLPATKPTRVADLDPLIRARGNESISAHIAARGGEDPKPLCVVAGTARRTGNWKLKAQAVYPDPDDWFEGICSRCLGAYENVTKREETV